MLTFLVRNDCCSLLTSTIFRDSTKIMNDEKEEGLFRCVETKDDADAVVELLLATKRFDLDSCWKGGKSLLMIAARNGFVSIVEELIDRGADVNLSAEDGNTALREAAKQNHPQVLRLLLKHGAYKNFVDRDGRTALMWACTRGESHTGVVKLLLDAGTDPNTIDKAGETALDLASRTSTLLLSFNAETAAQLRGTQDTKPALATHNLPDTWLTVFLLHHTMPHELIRHCNNILIAREGCGSADGLARAGKTIFTDAYLNSVGVYGVGLHMLLHNLCADLTHAYAVELKKVNNTQLAARAAVKKVLSCDEITKTTTGVSTVATASATSSALANVVRQRSSGNTVMSPAEPCVIKAEPPANASGAKRGRSDSI